MRDSADAGSTWHARRLPTEVSRLSAVTFGVTGSCVAVGTDADAAPRSIIVVSSDFGATWSVRGVGPDHDFATAIACVARLVSRAVVGRTRQGSLRR